jgi:hypothetical protein
VAQAGTPNYPTMLDAYGANRPPWNVAGVDYRVGADNGPFKDPSVAANLPACASFRSGAQQWVSIDSVPCTIDHFDFTMHNCIGLQAVGLNNPSGTATVTNNKFCAGTGWQPPGNGLFNSNSAINHVIRYNTFDEAYNGTVGSVISQLSTGDFTIEYNLFLRSSQAVTNMVYDGTFTVRYNVAVGLGCCATHGDWFILNGTATPRVFNESFNLVNSDQTSCCASALCYWSPNGSGPMTGGCTNDTYITAISTAADGPPGNGTVSYIVRIEPVTGNGPLTFRDNYMDLAGTLGPFLAAPVSGVAVNCSGNKNLNTGATLTYTRGNVSCS